MRKQFKEKWKQHNVLNAVAVGPNMSLKMAFVQFVPKKNIHYVPIVLNAVGITTK